MGLECHSPPPHCLFPSSPSLQTAMPTSLFGNDSHLGPRSLHNNAQGRSSTLSQYSDNTSVYNSTFVTRSPKNHPSNFLAITPETIPTKTFPQLRKNWIDTFPDGELDDEDLRRPTMAPNTSLELDDDGHSTEEEEDMPRMSVLGPSLRFHSRAPWELEGEGIQEEDETDFGVLLASSSKSRPSGESSRSQPKSYQSFETTSSQIHPRGALYALAQESLSTSSLGSSLSQPPSLKAFSLTRARSGSAGTASSTTLGVQSSNSIPSKALSPNSAAGTRPYNSSRKVAKSETSHPYANPAFALSHESTSSMYETTGATVIRSDSIATVTEPTSPWANSNYRLHTVSSISSLNFHRKPSVPSIHGREISSPMAISNSAIHPDDVASLSDTTHTTVSATKLPHIGHVPGWTDRGVPPPFNLISLEEARAQRSRAATQVSAHIKGPFPESMAVPSERSIANGQNPDLELERGIRAITGGKSKVMLASLVGTSPAHAKQEQAPNEPTPSGVGPPPGKTVKHRKSGFLRIFGGRVTGEKEDKSQPPPLPPLGTDFAHQNAQNPLKWSMIPRSPVHDFSTAISTPSSDDFQLSPTQSVTGMWTEPLNSKHSGSPLSLTISTRSPGDNKGRSATLSEKQPNRDISTSPISPQASPKKPWIDPSQPQSAPANMTEFPPLKLRPISTFFSSQFEGLLDAEPLLERPTTPSSTINSIFTTPVTPASPSRRTELTQVQTKSVAGIPFPLSAEAESIHGNERAWQQYIKDLEMQIRDLQAELVELRSGQYCSSCGRGDGHLRQLDESFDRQRQSILHRPRVPTGGTSRFVNHLQ